jgi:lipopolysaccharide transport system ATP-binding protein
MSSEPVISVRHLSKHYRIYERPHHRLMQMFVRGRRQYYREFWALSDVSFELCRGETLGIIGRNGAGKSTLLQLICGTLSPTSGEIVLRGRIAALLELGAGFNPDFTGRENVLMNAALMGFRPHEIAACYDDILAFADIGAFIDQPVKTYSSGMYVRLAFSVAIHAAPDILIVDEALAVGDALFQAKCTSRMKRMMDDGVTLLFISHDISAVKALCRQVLWLEQGRLRAYGPTVDISNAYIHDWVTQANRLHIDIDPSGGPAAEAAEAAEADAEPAEATPADAGPAEHNRSGTGQVRLRAINWRTPAGDAEQHPVNFGDRLTIEATVEVYAPCDKLIVNYHIKDRHAQYVLGNHSYECPAIYGREWRPGDRFRVRFSLKVPLCQGNYYLTMLVTSISDLKTYSDAVFLDLVEDVAVMHVTARERFPLSDLVEAEDELETAVLESAPSLG